MTATITLFEHETKEFDWTDRDLVALERLHRAFGAEVLRVTPLRSGRYRLKATQYVGVVRLGRHTIQMLPKIYQSSDTADERQRAREATHNLLYLLEYAGRLPLREYAFAPLLRRDLDWFEILTRLFALHLMDEWQRGVIRSYVVVEDDLPALKGKWRFADQLRRPERKHIFAVAYDEFTADNRLNRVFRYVVERLWHLTRDPDNRQRLSTLRQWMEEVTLLRSVNIADASPALITRLNRQYEPLLNLARLFLDDGALQLAAGDLTTFAFVLDMNQLFEAFMVNFIRRYRDEILPPDLRGCRLRPQSRGITFHLARRNGQSVFRLKPDLTLQRVDGTFPMLLDTKYKILDADSLRLGIAAGDFYQMFTYAHRYNCSRVLLIYPQTTAMLEPLRAWFALEGNDKVIEAATMDLRVELGKQEGRDEIVRELKDILQEGAQP